MKEYTLLAASSVILTVYIDKISGIRVLKKKIFYLFLLIIMFFKILVNGYLTSGQIVLYNPDFFLGIRVGSIPLEDFLFGFSMVSLTVIFWEYFLKKLK
ncbi:MAG: lycopene cyclase domain-containing protein [Candidatus Omnitrophica bacterium]|nr:lycopene cyclase domain-containing protein [Candidatus Omnitrophota bacterium]